MTPAMIDTLIVLVEFLSVSAVGLIGLKIFLNHRSRKQELEAGGSASELREAVDQLRGELEATQLDLRADTAELHERLDFTERLLAQRAPPDLPKPRANTPA